MDITITINCDNAAFEDDNGGPEVARILRELAEACADGCGPPNLGGSIRDINGNTVGQVTVTQARRAAR